MESTIFNEIEKILECDFASGNPEDKNLARFATSLAFSLAEELRKSPISVAGELAAEFQEHSYFDKVEALNGYLNFRLPKTFLNELANKALQNPSEFSKGEDETESFLLEYVSVNPTGPSHIGHVRGAAFGDTLTRLARHLGYKFNTEYYVNNAGSQVYLLELSILLSVKENILHENVEYPERYYKGEYIADLAKKAFEKFGKEFFSEESIPSLADWAKDKMLVLIKQNSEQAKIKIDSYVNERSYYDALNATSESLKEHKGIYEQEGKTWLAFSQKGDEKDRAIIREDGRGTYLAADIVYHKDKMSRGYGKCINIWGADHHGYIPRMKVAMEFLGFDFNNLEIILAQMVSLLKDGEPYKMSKRVGNFILMSDVVDEIRSDALRYIFLSKEYDMHLELDISDLQKEDSSNPVYYINYAHARIHQVFARAGRKIDDVMKADLQSLNQDGVNLLFEALNLKAVLNDAFEARALQKIPDYLKNLAVNFHKFYNENKVVGSVNENDLLKLLSLAALSTKTVFSLMGIEAKNKMGR